MDRRNPWFRPEAASMVLFGPGVMEATRAKAVRGPKVLQKDMRRKTPFAEGGRAIIFRKMLLCYAGGSAAAARKARLSSN
ncbi:hypothetical protein AA14362_0205 [Acetobacter cerevisiae DSM 14362]|nr:hypothetical protein AA14362_0205 [Acetobacter cerevisiae DSM 14362]